MNYTIKDFEEMLKKIENPEIPMENCFAKAIRAFNETGNCKIDLVEKTLLVGRKKFIYKGTFHGTTPLEEYKLMVKELGLIIDPGLEDMEMFLDYLYDRYANSYPESNEAERKHNYFKAKRMEELSDKQLAVNLCRGHERVLLEGWILVSSLLGTWVHEPIRAKWFWQSKRHPEFVILNDWV